MAWLNRVAETYLERVVLLAARRASRADLVATALNAPINGSLLQSAPQAASTTCRNDTERVDISFPQNVSSIISKLWTSLLAPNHLNEAEKEPYAPVLTKSSEEKHFIHVRRLTNDILGLLQLLRDGHQLIEQRGLPLDLDDNSVRVSSLCSRRRLILRGHARTWECFPFRLEKCQELGTNLFSLAVESLFSEHSLVLECVTRTRKRFRQPSVYRQLLEGMRNSRPFIRSMREVLMTPPENNSKRTLCVWHARQTPKHCDDVQGMRTDGACYLDECFGRTRLLHDE